MYVLFFVFCVLFVCKSVAALLLPVVNPFAVKYIIIIIINSD